MDNSWLPAVEEVFEYFADRTPGAFIHRTNCTIAWYHSYSNYHYRGGNVGGTGDQGGWVARGGASFNSHGSIQSKDLLIHLDF